MNYYQMGTIESSFAEIIWENEPISSTELSRLAEEKLNWKKSTTYTVLRRLCDKGIFENTDGKVRSLISKEEFYSLQSENFVDETFSGSLPAFLAAFSRRKKLTAEEISEIKKLIDGYKEE